VIELNLRGEEQTFWAEGYSHNEGFPK